MKPNISVIVPCYGVEKFLDRCMESLVNQTLKEIEIILVDDGSPDKVPAMCDEWASKDPRIKVIHKKNEGLGYARNSGIEIATGEYIAFVDSDDYVDVQMFEKLHVVTRKIKYDVVYCGRKAQGPTKTFIDQYSFNEEFLTESSVETLLSELTASNDVCTLMPSRMQTAWGAIFNSELFAKYDLKFKSERTFLCEDVVFDHDLYPHCKSVKYIPDCLYYYCYNKTSLSRSFKTVKVDNLQNLYNYLKKLPWTISSDSLKLSVDKMYSHYAIIMQYQIAISDLRLNEKRRLIGKLNKNDVWQKVLHNIDARCFPKLAYCRLLLCRYNLITLSLCLNKLVFLIKNNQFSSK